jgi:DNA-binding LacI/PurR family transcriptional regulator
MANIKDVAKLANVSISTVSSVINNNKIVSDELRKRIEDAIKELDYQTSPVARSLKNRKSGTIGVILPNITSIFFPQVLTGIENTAYKHGYSIIYFNSHQNISKEKKYIEMLAHYFVEGIIVDSSVDIKNSSGYIRFLTDKIIQKYKIPIISLERPLCDDKIGSVKVDNAYGGYLVTKHLIEMGHKSIAHISGHMGVPMSLDRISGYRKALQEYGLDYNEGLIKSGDFSPLSGYNEMKELLDQRISFTAVFAGNDQETIGAIKAIKEAGMRVPQDIAVAGFDDISVATLVEPALTTISFSKYDMGAMAVEALIQSINKPDSAPAHQSLDIRLAVRNSSDPASISSWNLDGW